MSLAAHAGQRCELFLRHSAMMQCSIELSWHKETLGRTNALLRTSALSLPQSSSDLALRDFEHFLRRPNCCDTELKPDFRAED